MELQSEAMPLFMGRDKSIIENVRDHGIIPFIKLNKKLEKKNDSIYSDDSDQSDINNCESLKWGDEVSSHSPFA